jgi:hypothetical protein
MIDIGEVMRDLSWKRPIFHSEADFQHALAWTLHERLPAAEVRLEYKPFADERFYLDVWLRNLGVSVALELKYPTRAVQTEVGGERYSLTTQGAQDLTRYDFVKDIGRVERVVAHGKAATGYAILLTNDSSFWTLGQRVNTIDAAFRLHEGQTLQGELAWSGLAGNGTTRGRQASHRLSHSYSIRWNGYSNVTESGFGSFRYFAVTVPASTDSLRS